MRSKKLARQIKKSFGDENFELTLISLLGDEKIINNLSTEDRDKLLMLREMPAFLLAIDDSYGQSEKMLALAHNNLDFSSKELTEVNNSLSTLNQTLDAMVNSLGQAFLLFNAEGVCSPVFSRKCQQMLECTPGGLDIAEVLRIPAADREVFRDWCALLASGTMDFDDLCLLGPKKFPHSAQREIWLEYKPVKNLEGQITFILVIATDRTEEMAAIEAAEEMRAFAGMVVKMVQGKSDFLQFLGACERSIAAIRAILSTAQFGHAEHEKMKFQVHTLKGASAAFSVRGIERICHHFEEKAAVASDATQSAKLAREMIVELEAEHGRVIERSREILGAFLAQGEHCREVPVDVLWGFARRLKAAGQAVLLEEFEKRVLAEPARQLFQPFQRVVSQVAYRLQKRVQPLALEGGDVPLVREPYEDVFAALVHVFRNMVDHGLEPAAERESSGKPEEGRISVRIEQSGDRLLFAIADDGRGIPIDRVKKRLAEMGRDVASMSEAEITMAIFLPGFSTAEIVTDISGRGVGLSALKEAVDKLGGKIAVQNRIGQGCTFVLDLPYLGFSYAASDEAA